MSEALNIPQHPEGLQVRTLAETWRLWREGGQYEAFLGDGSKIKAVGRPCRWVCEVHSERGVEYRQSDERVIWKPITKKV